MTLDFAHLLVAAATVVSVLTAVIMHYEVFVRISLALDRGKRHGRQRIVAMVLALIVVHVVEIWLFAAAAWALLLAEGTGGLLPGDGLRFLDYVYLSAVTFTTVGYGDIVPHGPIRFLYGTEALAGFALITWSASLTFLEMQRHWKTHDLG